MLSHFKSSTLACLLAGTALATLAGAASAQTSEVVRTADAGAVQEDTVDEIIVIGAGQTRSVSTLTP